MWTGDNLTENPQPVRIRVSFWCFSAACRCLPVSAFSVPHLTLLTWHHWGTLGDQHCHHFSTSQSAGDNQASALLVLSLMLCTTALLTCSLITWTLVILARFSSRLCSLILGIKTTYHFPPPVRPVDHQEDKAGTSFTHSPFRHSFSSPPQGFMTSTSTSEPPRSIFLSPPGIHSFLPSLTTLALCLSAFIAIFVFIINL